MPALCKFPCRQEVMDLVNASGKFSKKFEAFTGEILNDRESRGIQGLINCPIKTNHSQYLLFNQYLMVGNI